jgi:hypothetical protein
MAIKAWAVSELQMGQVGYKKINMMRMELKL